MNILKEIRKDKALFGALGVVALCILFAGCVPSLYPLFTPETVVFKEELVGTWQEKPDSKENWKFEKGEEKVYKLTLSEEDGKSSPFEARLVKLDQLLFLDLFPLGDALENAKLGTWFRMSIIPGHLIIKVGKIGETLELSLMEPDWLKQQLQKDPKMLDHAFLDKESFVITAKTAELQAFFKKHANTKEAWGEPGVLNRQK
jgi:hypothetical protein